jgi:hypothetical protein
MIRAILAAGVLGMWTGVALVLGGLLGRVIRRADTAPRYLDIFDEDVPLYVPAEWSVYL